ncbi:coenzyme F420-0:L-glutamate ligase [Cumulibacter soli]|uniref:coenzyme F420-0:L-glutamate ligase n=1 Tax=Cumulibacter soli TaxID=2546344 RepID=UPI0010682935|nr:coenzyme F420-0:L-glutamate ligase [Cumulibacter soli]
MNQGAGLGAEHIAANARPATEDAVDEPLAEQYTVRAIRGLPDFRPGDDLIAAICSAAPWIADGDVLAITSKAVSKAEGRLTSTGTDEVERAARRREVIDAETTNVVAERRGVRIVRNALGLTMAAAGVDASNVNADEIATLPLDPDASARRIRDGIRAQLGRDVAVVITDTTGRTWRSGLVDIAIGSAGIAPLRDLRGGIDTHGHPLAVTALAQVDEIASASELVRGKLGRVAAAVIRGIPWRAQETPGAGVALIRPIEEDMFCFGARDVVPAAQHASFTDGCAREEQITDAIARVRAPAGIRAAVAGSAVSVRGDDEFALGIYVGQLVVALRAEGLAAELTRVAEGADLRLAQAAPYEGIE